MIAQCGDNNGFKYFLLGQDRFCADIKSDENFHSVLCPVPMVNRNCPVACGKCCEDDDQYEFIRINGNPATCEWLSKRENRISKFCNDDDKITLAEKYIYFTQHLTLN